MRSVHLYFTALVLIFVPLFGISCGGGSAGTGIKTVEGSVRTTTDLPIAGVTVTVLETGESDITDEGGLFLIETTATSEAIDLELTSPTLNATVSVPNTVTEESNTINVEIGVDSDTATVVVQNITDVKAQIVGECDVYFENNRIIRQSNPVPSQLTCVSKVTVTGVNGPLANVPFAIQVRKCPKKSVWRTIAEGETRSGVDAGVGQLPFTFIDDKDNCVYQILTPFGPDQPKPVVYEIHTFTKQAFDKK